METNSKQMSYAMTPHQIESFYNQLLYYQIFSKALRTSFRKRDVITMPIEFTQWKFEHRWARQKKRIKHYLKNLCTHYTHKYIALVRGEVEFSRKIKLLKGKDI